MAAVFISYRRADTKHPTSRVHDRLRAEFGKENVFKDVDSIPVGSDFRAVLRDVLTRCRVALVMIGPGWVNAADADGGRRLLDTDDLVRLEVEAALARGIPVVPVLLDGARMPGPAELPESLRPLCDRHAVAVGDDPQFDDDVARLVRSIRRLLDGGSAAEPVPGSRVQLELPGGPPLEFVWCPPGSFLMGRDGGEPEEKPLHRVNITRGFYMGAFPVTQAQWRAVLGTDPSYHKGDDCPVEHVSWNDCQAFCGAVNRQRAGNPPVRLPTEAEWEYACRAGTTTLYSSGDGDEALKRVGWCRDNTDGKPRPVGLLAANAWGLHDTHGNVWEWCQDNMRTYSVAEVTDPEAELHEKARVVRGGSILNSARGCRSSSRRKAGAAYREDFIGLRVCFRPG